ncbi:MAG TPA: hypothetical protein VM146_06815 [Steroidobacteraceae bacterium]|nr:hypothetical protein [Steroidobacteraceae bacterium]
MNLRLLGLLVLICAHRACFAAGLPDYIRYAEDGTSARLEVAIKTFTLPSGQKVDLVGAVHIADASYYQALNRRFPAYDSVLFELVGDPKRLTDGASIDDAPTADAQRARQAGGGAVSALQQSAARALKLTFQLGAIDYTGKNMVHADMTLDEFAQMQQERGESMATLFARAMQAQMSGSLNGTASNELDMIGLLKILVSPDSTAAFKQALAKTFDQAEAVTAALEGNEKSAILSGRNDVVAKKIGEVLADRKQRHIAVFYGGAHMPGIEAALTQQMKAKASGEEWLAAWTMLKTPPADTSRAPGTAKPAS